MSSFHRSHPDDAGSVSGAPNLPEGFTDTFTSRYIDTGEVRLHGGPLHPSGWQLALTTAGMVAVVNGVVIQRRHHRRASDAYRPEAVDRAAIFVPSSR